MTKVCSSCKIEKSTDEYYRSWDKRDGLNCYCKSYVSIKSKEYRKRNPQKCKTRRLFSSAVKKGTIKRPKYCSVCGKKCKPEGHHEDYDKPYEVMWMCEWCHCKHHAKINRNKLLCDVL